MKIDGMEWMEWLHAKRKENATGYRLRGNAHFVELRERAIAKARELGLTLVGRATSSTAGKPRVSQEKSS